MKKALITSMLIMLVITVCSIEAKSEPANITENIPQNQQPTVMELAFLRELGPSILDATRAHGDMKLYTSGRIEKIVRNKQNDFYDVTLRVITFEGALNPPYKLIRITFRIPDNEYYSGKNRVISYVRKDIDGEEFVELSKYTGY